MYFTELYYIDYIDSKTISSYRKSAVEKDLLCVINFYSI